MNHQDQNSQNQQAIQFPVTYDLKTIFLFQGDTDVLRVDLIRIFNDKKIQYEAPKHHFSRNQKFISFSTRITVISKEQMDDLYEKLNTLENIKFAI